MKAKALYKKIYRNSQQFLVDLTLVGAYTSSIYHHNGTALPQLNSGYFPPSHQLKPAL